jgi:hypothetical protein
MSRGMWIEHDDQWFNLSHFSQIWVEMEKGEYYLMGQIQDNVAQCCRLTKNFKDKKDLIKKFWRDI